MSSEDRVLLFAFKYITLRREEKLQCDCTNIVSCDLVYKDIYFYYIYFYYRCVIHNCILCNGCTIEEGTELKDCIVGANHVVKSGSQYSREVLTDADRLIEI